MRINRKLIAIFNSCLFLLVIAFFGCSDDDPGDVIFLPKGDISIEDKQVISMNTLLVDQVMVNSNSWLVARHTDANGAIIDRVLLTDETSANIEFKIDETISDRDTIYLALYIDDAVGEGDGKFEEGGDDTLIPDTAEIVTIISPSFSITNTTVVNNSLTFDNVTIGKTGWLVLYDLEADSENNVIGGTFITGSEENVVVEFSEDFTFTPGQDILARLHIDDPADEVFTYETDQTQDIPEIFGFGPDNIIQQSINIE